MKIILTIPAYNEEEALPELLEAFRREMSADHQHSSIVIVNDGSTDGTCRVIREWASAAPIELLQHAANRGLGETIQDGLRRATELADAEDIIVTMDADNTHSPVLIPEMARRISDGWDVVIASRYQPGAGVVGLSVFRRLMSGGARILFQLLFPITGVRDYTCGFRAYRAGVLQEASSRRQGRLVTETSFACMAEILLKLRRMGAKMCEVPMILRYDQKKGATKMKVGRTILRTLSLMLRTRLAP